MAKVIKKLILLIEDDYKLIEVTFCQDLITIFMVNDDSDKSKVNQV